MSFKKDAIKKLSEKPKSLSKHADVVKDAVIAQLKNFCEQNEEFAQAVVQSAGTVGECLENVVSGCGNSLSDVEAYSKAVAFWFPGAKISFAIKLVLGDGGTSNQVEAEFTEVQAAAPESGAREQIKFCLSQIQAAFNAAVEVLDRVNESEQETLRNALNTALDRMKENINA